MVLLKWLKGEQNLGIQNPESPLNIEYQKKTS